MDEIHFLEKQNKEIIDSLNKVTNTMVNLFDLAMGEHKKKAILNGELSYKDLTHNEVVPSCPGFIEKHELMKKHIKHTHALKGRRKIQGTKITGPEARLVKKTYATNLTKERYQEIIDHLLKGKRSFPELKALTGYNGNNLYAHLIFGEKIGEIKKLYGNLFYELSETKVKELNHVVAKT